MNHLQENFIYLRSKSGLNQAQLSLSLGFSRSAWNNYEKGKSKPSIDDLHKISKYFGLSTSQLLEADLQNVHLNENAEEKKVGEIVHVKVHPGVHLKLKKAQKEPCKECEIKDIIIQGKDQLLQANIKLIHSQEAQIKLLQNQIDQMKYDTHEREKTQYTPKKEQKTA